MPGIFQLNKKKIKKSHSPFGSCAMLRGCAHIFQNVILENHDSRQSQNYVREFYIIKCYWRLQRRRKRPKIVHVGKSILQEFIILDNGDLHPSQPWLSDNSHQSSLCFFCFRWSFGRVPNFKINLEMAVTCFELKYSSDRSNILVVIDDHYWKLYHVYLN